MKRLRSISVVTGQAVVRRPLLPVAIDAESHRVVDDTLSDRHLREIAMTGRAVLGEQRGATRAEGGIDRRLGCGRLGGELGTVEPRA